MQAAIARHEPLDHLLLYGPPGLGKTTLAGIIAAEMGHNIRITSGPAIERAGDLASILTNLSGRGRAFHRRDPSPQPHRGGGALPAMEDFALDIMIGKGPSARSIRLDLPKFTLIGATTRAGMLTSPLRDASASTSGWNCTRRRSCPSSCSARRRSSRSPCDTQGALEIARRSRGHAAHRQPPRAPRARFCRGGGRRHNHPRRGAAGAEDARGGRTGPRPHRPHAFAHDDRKIRRRAGGSGHAGRLHRRGTPPPSRTSTSRTFCNWASSCARRAAAWPPPPPTSIWD